MTPGSSRIQWQVFTSIPFCAALALLLLNDFVLKGAFGNAITGKLSDFAGLLLLAMFLGAFFPRRLGACCAFVALFFTCWKSPLAEPVIEAFNSLGPFAIGRVPDYTDLAALLILPVAVVSLRRIHMLQWPPPPSRPVLALPLLALSVFAMAATSGRYETKDINIDLGQQIGKAAPTAEDVAAAVDAFLRARGFAQEQVAGEMVYFGTAEGNDLHRLRVRVAAIPEGVEVGISAFVSGFSSKAPGKKLRREIEKYLEKEFPGIHVR